MIVLLCFGLSILFPQQSFSQVSKVNSNYLDWFDKIIGIENIGLYNGVAYIPKFNVYEDSHPYFISQEFQKGDLFYNGQPYFNINLKYDIFFDEILIEVNKGFGKGTVQIIKDKVEGFQIRENKFVNLNHDSEKINLNGFYEIISEFENFNLYKKHNLKTSRISDNRIVYRKFKITAPTYYLQYKNDFYQIKSRKDLVKIFPSYKKEIYEYYNRNLIKYKEDAALNILLKRLNELYTTKPDTKE